MNVSEKKRINKQDGFTAIEIAIVVVVVGIVGMMSVMLFSAGKARYDLRRKAQKVSSQIDRARSLSIKYNQTLTLGFTSENSVFGLTCSTCSAAKSELPSVQLP